jgi:hypothetical protein
MWIGAMIFVTAAAGHARGAVGSRFVTRLQRGRNGPAVAAMRFVSLLSADAYAYAMQHCKQGRT